MPTNQAISATSTFADFSLIYLAIV